MMQVTRAAFQAQASLNQQATDPMSHTLVRTFLHKSLSSCYLLNSMVDPEHVAFNDWNGAKRWNGWNDWNGIRFW
jgi:hypothetical protein